MFIIVYYCAIFTLFSYMQFIFFLFRVADDDFMSKHVLRI